MNKNVPILTCDIDDATHSITSIKTRENLDYLPIGINPSKDHLRKNLNDWWRNRSIPVSRQGLATVLQKLDIPDKDYLLIKGLGLSLSDQYWFRPDPLTCWDDINFFNNPFSEELGDIFFGKPASKEMDLFGPDITSDGWLKKRWKIINGERCLIKGGSGTLMQEPINEAFVSSFIERLGFENFTPYSLELIDNKPYSICKNFIDVDTELVSADQILRAFPSKSNNINMRTHFLNCCDSLGIPDADTYLDFMLSLDYVVANSDRHFTNFGAIRNIKNLTFVGMAPIYDNGTSLWCDKSDYEISYLDRSFTSKPFSDSPSRQIELVTSFEPFSGITTKDTPATFSGEFSRLLAKSPTITDDRSDLLCSCFERRIEKMQYMVKTAQSPAFHQKERSISPTLSEQAHGAASAQQDPGKSLSSRENYNRMDR